MYFMPQILYLIAFKREEVDKYEADDVEIYVLTDSFQQKLPGVLVADHN